MFRPERLAETLALVPQTPVGLVTIRVLIGAPYLAMGFVTVYAALRGQWAWLVPVAIIEGVMAVVRIGSGLSDGFGAAGVHFIAAEIVMCVVLVLGAVVLSGRQGR